MTSDRSSSSTHGEPQIQFSIWHTFKRHIPHVIVTILVDVVLPLIIYFSLQRHIKPVYALLIAGAPPFAMVVFKGIVSRTFDALGFLISFGFIISGIVAIITRNPIILLLEKSLVTCLSSLIFAITLIPFPCCHHRCQLRPLAYYFYQDLVPTTRAQIGLPENFFPHEQQSNNNENILISKLSDKQEIAKVYEWIYTHCPPFRFSCYMITGVWAIGLLLEFLAKLTLIIVHLSVNKLVIYGNVILVSVAVICVVLTIICITKERKQTIVFIEQWKKDHLNIQ
jgi:hypothetical protein